MHVANLPGLNILWDADPPIGGRHDVNVIESPHKKRERLQKTLSFNILQPAMSATASATKNYSEQIH